MFSEGNETRLKYNKDIFFESLYLKTILEKLLKVLKNVNKVLKNDHKESF